MKFIPTRVHSVTDYVLAPTLVVVPLIVADIGAVAAVIFIVIGLLLLIQNLVTEYEYTVANIIPVRAHLAIDSIAGGFLAVSPWLLGFYRFVFWPHVIVGLAIWGMAVVTKLPQTAPRGRVDLSGPPSMDPRSPRRMTS